MSIDADSPVDTKNGFVLKNRQTEDSISSIIAKINENGDLVIEGYDAGGFVEEFWGDSDYEYWITIGSRDKDVLLMKLLEEHVGRDSAIRKWLEKSGIPFQFSSWV